MNDNDNNNDEKRRLPRFNDRDGTMVDKTGHYGVSPKELWAGHSGALKDMHVFASTGQNGASDAERAAVASLAQAWMNRLQTLSAVTTFFAGMDGSLLGLTLQVNGVGDTSQIVQSGLAGALVVHIAASVIAYIASFFLLEYQIFDAKKSVKEGTPPPGGDQGGQGGGNTAGSGGAAGATTAPNQAPNMPQSSAMPDAQSSSVGKMSAQPSQEPTFVSNPYSYGYDNDIYLRRCTFPYGLPVWYPGQTKNAYRGPDPFHIRSADAPPLHMLTRAHTLCVWLAILGFVLALVGVEAYCWSALPQATSIFVSSCLGACVLLGIWVLRP